MALMYNSQRLGWIALSNEKIATFAVGTKAWVNAQSRMLIASEESPGTRGQPAP